MVKRLKRNEVVAFIIMLTISVFSVSFIPCEASAEVILTQISPSEGFVGTEVTLDGQITTENGSYEILFDDKVLQEGNATFTSVSDSFIVPDSTLGLHDVVIKDVSNGTLSPSMNFTVQTNYIIQPISPEEPRQFQEGSNVTILASITGGEANRTYHVNATVKDPAEITVSTRELLLLSNSSGSAEIYVGYDGNKTTYFVGTYELTLLGANVTLATGNFNVGITDKTEYHRFQTVNIQAINYTISDIINITITHNGQLIFEHAPNGSEGVITANWTIPANASLGNYRVKIDKKPLEKQVQDIQNFTIVSKSFVSEVKALNLDLDPVKGVLIEANNLTDNAVSSSFTNEEGIALFNLEDTNYTFIAFWNSSEAPRAQVGATHWISIDGNLTGNEAPKINCTLAKIKIAVEDEEGYKLPGITLRANFTYISRLDVPINVSLSTETGLTGFAEFKNVLTNTSYEIDASRYGYTFQRSKMNLTSTQWFNFTAPTYDLSINVYDRNGSVLQNGQVRIYEWGVGLSGLIATENTGNSGHIALSATFGKYELEVYKSNTLLNRTIVFLTNQPTNFAVHCKLYSLSLNVAVVDFFGQGVVNVNVTIERNGIMVSSSITEVGGVAKFSELIGGDYRAFVYIENKPYGITTLHLEDPKTARIRIAEIVSIGGFIVETSHLITGTMILLAVAVIILFVFYRKFKPDLKDE